MFPKVQTACLLKSLTEETLNENILVSAFVIVGVAASASEEPIWTVNGVRCTVGAAAIQIDYACHC